MLPSSSLLSSCTSNPQARPSAHSLTHPHPHPRCHVPSRCLVLLHPLKRSISTNRRLPTPPCASNQQPPNNDQFTPTPSDVVDFIDELLEKSAENLKEGREVEASVVKYLREHPDQGWFVQPALRQVRKNLANEEQWATALRSSRQRVIQLPPNTDFFTMVGEVVDANEDLEALAEATEGPFAIVTAGSKVLGALVFCWAVGALSTADAYRYWGLPDGATGDLLTTWLTWTGPCVGALLLLAAFKQVDSTQGIRQLPQLDEQAQSEAAVDKLGLVGNVLLTGGMALASGLVFRGIWLDIFANSVFVPSDMSSLLDPDLSDSALLRNSFGTLLPSIPVPPALLVVGACLSAAGVETLHRLWCAVLTGIQVDNEIMPMQEQQKGGAPRTPAQQTEVLNDSDEWVQVSVMEGDEDGNTVTVSAAIRISSIVAEYVLAAVLCAETLATHSLWMSMGTHAACMLVAIYALKAGLGRDDDDDDEVGTSAGGQAKTTAAASARD